MDVFYFFLWLTCICFYYTCSFPVIDKSRRLIPVFTLDGRSDCGITQKEKVIDLFPKYRCDVEVANYSQDYFDNRGYLPCIGIYDSLYRLCEFVDHFEEIKLKMEDYDPALFCDQSNKMFSNLNFTYYGDELKRWGGLVKEVMTDSSRCRNLCIVGKKVNRYCSVMLTVTKEYVRLSYLKQNKLGVFQDKFASDEKEAPQSTLDENPKQPLLNTIVKNEVTNIKSEIVSNVSAVGVDKKKKAEIPEEGVKSVPVSSTTSLETSTVQQSVPAVDESPKVSTKEQELVDATITKPKFEDSVFEKSKSEDSTLGKPKSVTVYSGDTKTSDDILVGGLGGELAKEEVSIITVPSPGLSNIQHIPLPGEVDTPEEDKFGGDVSEDQRAAMGAPDSEPDLIQSDRDKAFEGNAPTDSFAVKPKQEEECTINNDDMKIPEEERPNDLMESVQHSWPSSELIRDNFVETEDSNFFTYFAMMTALCILAYVAFHNKNKILALALEGRKGRGSRGRGRPSSANYSKLHSNLEEAIASNAAAPTPTHVLY